MKKAALSIITLIALSGILTRCASHEQNNDQPHSTDSTSQTQNNYTINDLNGDWTLVKVETIEEKQSVDRYREFVDPDVATEWSPPVFLNADGILIPTDHNFYYVKNRDLHILEDSIYWLNYPLLLERKSAFTIEADFVTVGNDPDIRHVELSPDKDSLTLSYLEHYGLYIKETYQKVTFNDSILDVLKLYETNLPLFAGKWQVFREGSVGNDGSYYELNFPYKIPDVIQVTKEELIDIMLNNATYSMLTDGRKRDYSLTYYDREFILSPTDWLPDDYQGSSSIILDRLTKERQELSPQDCWKEFLQVITSGDISHTIDLMTDDGYFPFWDKMAHSEFELKLKHLGRVWQEWDVTWGKISATKATATFGPTGKEHQMAFVKDDGLWKIDLLSARA